jgi:hypothetical protein
MRRRVDRQVARSIAFWARQTAMGRFLYVDMSAARRARYARWKRDNGLE